MKLISKLRLFFVLMLVLALSGAVLSVWSARQAGYFLERINLAHKVYEANLQLSNHTYQLFKQFGDALIVGEPATGPNEKAMLISKIRGDIDRIRLLIGQEIELVGDEEIPELEELSRLELQIESLFRELSEIALQPTGADIAGNWERLSRILDGDIDKDFRARIESAVAEEAEEARETHILAQERLLQFQGLSAIFAAIAAFTALLGFVALRRGVHRPIVKLNEGARQLSGGDLAHRIDVRGRDEIAELADVLNQLAERVEARERRLTSSNEDLEQKVADRTARLEHLLNDSQKAENNRKRLMADVSHELRTPLTIIRGEADIALRGSKQPEDYREALARVREAATHTARLVDDLLFVARSEAGEAKLTMREVDLLQMANGLVDEKERAIPVLTSLTAAPMQGDQDRLQQVLLILLDNARHYGGNAIEIQLHRDSANTYSLTVADDGPGMTEDEKRQAFDRFFRGSDAARRYDLGTGLGLPVARSIIQAHGGEITLEDRPGGGLMAAVTLPAKPLLRAVS